MVLIWDKLSIGTAQTAAAKAAYAIRTQPEGVPAPLQVRQLVAYLAQRKAQRAQQLQYTPARVSRVVPVGMGDRACVDLASLLVPGEVRPGCSGWYDMLQAVGNMSHCILHPAV